ncbi:hypothetical protein SAMN03159406_03692 [Rhizobium sp. NFR03]|nr:hypothetical protein SAMN03159406_03692 [Rhizobium sp. NFR03]
MTDAVGIKVAVSRLPLTLTLSPHAGRGDVACSPFLNTAAPRSRSLLPVETGRRWRQPDEGHLTGNTKSHPHRSGDPHASRS